MRHTAAPVDRRLLHQRPVDLFARPRHIWRVNNIIPLPGTTSSVRQIAFTRQELDRIMSLYGRMVAAGLWRDYALELGPKQASFSAYRRAAENPEARLVKDPALRQRQGEWVLYGEGGMVLKRGHELAGVLSVLERRLLKAVEG